MRTAYVFYHYLYPDDVVSSIHISELCAGLVKRGWDVTAFPCNRSCRDNTAKYPRGGSYNGVKIERIWRPPWRQSSGIGRVLNSLWMIFRWSLLSLQNRRKPDVVIVGTDPSLSVLIAIAWRIFKPDTILVSWCFDLYPEAAFADGLLNRHGVFARLLHGLLKKAYRACDLVVDIGPCMRELILRYDPSLPVATLVPWALKEPDQVLAIPTDDHRTLFGDSPFGMLYSGNFGRAHSHNSILELARVLSVDSSALTFSVRGNRVDALRAAVRPEDANVRFVPFASEENLLVRLAAADVHVVTLRDEWTGTVVPSKFFGALAVGRPVLFCGDRNSSVAQWIKQYDLGWTLTQDNIHEVAASIREQLSDSSAMQKRRERCHEIYSKHFSREIVLAGWERHLSELLAKRSSRAPS